MAGYSPGSKQIQMTVADDEFSCPLCCEVFEEPKLLSNCAHSFCKKCLRELVLHTGSSHVSCPVCRKISNVPEKGVDGFATNTLLVRLIDNIPGKKEKDEVSKALARCKDEMGRHKEFQDQLQKRLAKINENKEKGEKLKREISQHADDAIDSIRRNEQKLHQLVDDSLKENCGLAFHENLEKHRKKWQNHMDLASGCVKTVEETLQRNELEEIMEMKKMMIEQLKEYSSFPPCPSLSEIGEVKNFAMQFKKLEIKEDVLGEVEEIAENPQNEFVCFGDALTHAISTYLHLQNRVLSRPHVITDVSLSFEPFQMAVCPNTGQIALLWENRRKVYIYSQQGHHQSTISIKYGDLWDVGFTTDDEVVVVNRQQNRLLFYEKDGLFIPKELDPPRDSLKFTYVSIDDGGRLIVTSTETSSDDDDDDEEIIPCIIVYNHGSEVSCKMFGRRHLDRPVSRAIYKNGKFYVADECNDGQILIKCFTHQGQACANCPVVSDDINTDVSLSTDTHSDKVFFCQRNVNGCFIKVLEDGMISQTRVFHDNLILNKAAVLSSDSESITQAEIYNGFNSMRVVKYSL